MSGFIYRRSRMPTMICSYLGAQIDRNLLDRGDYWGDVFNLNLVDPVSFNLLPRHLMKDNYLPEVWQQKWTLDYLESLANKFDANPNAVISLHFDHIFYSNTATALIQKLNPQVINLVPENELDAIKIYLNRRSAKSREATLDDFTAAYQHCVLCPKLVPAFFNVSKTLIVKDALLSYIQDGSADNSTLRTKALLNETQVEQWYKAVSQN